VKDNRKFLRKPTSVVHVGAGMLAAQVYPLHPGLSVMLVTSFGCFEFWQERKIADTGCLDFWELVLGLFIGAWILWLRAVTGL